jgi:hypothetical protein
LIVTRYFSVTVTVTFYSRGYKNRAIVKKLFEFSPIFYEGIEGQLFMLMRFFNSSKDLTSMLGSFLARRSTWAALGGRDGPPFSSYCNFLQDA